MSRSHTSPRLRAGHALLLAILMLAAILFGTPGRHDRQEAMAQAPAMPPARAARAAAPPAPVPVPFPVPTEL